MKNFLKITALLVATTFPCVAFSGILGAPIPGAFNLENGATLFASLLIGLTFLADYARPVRKLTLASAANCTACKGESHRLAA
ncbi:MAG: hypothetical protein ABIV50_11165 [Opitutus sp.]